MTSLEVKETKDRDAENFREKRKIPHVGPFSLVLSLPLSLLSPVILVFSVFEHVQKPEGEA